MRFNQVLASSAAFVSSASALANETTTVVSTAFTTFCPSPTVIPIGNVTYTVTEPTTLTITNCPCTLTSPVVPPPHSVVPPPHSVVPPPPPTETTRPSAPSHTPIGPSTTGPPIVPTAAADKTKAGLGALIIAGVAALAL